MGKKYSVNFQLSVPTEMQLSNYSTAHFSEFLWALSSFRRIAWFLALFSSYWKTDKEINRSAVIIKQIRQI